MDLFNLQPNKAFLVSVKAIIVHNERVLLLHSSDLHGNWEFPGGLVNMEESFVDGVVREVKEETTLEVLVGDPVWASDDWRKNFRFQDGAVRDVRVVEIVYRCKVLSPNIENIVLSDEHSEYTWATSQELDVLPMFSYHRRPLKERIFKTD